jgi:hypothetical protein
LIRQGLNKRGRIQSGWRHDGAASQETRADYFDQVRHEADPHDGSSVENLTDAIR